jgi:hypothetical protein
VGQFALTRQIHLVAHILHIDVHDIGGGIGGHVPNLFEQSCAGDRLARIAHHELEDGEFAGCEVDAAAVALDPVLLPVKRQIADFGAVRNHG